LFDFDITAFKEMPPHVRSAIRAMNQTVVVSEIRHHIGPHRARCKVVHGYVVANSSDRLIRVYQTNSGAVSQRILDTVVPFITDVNSAKAA
jgi:predicted HD phosphohydrolase